MPWLALSSVQVTTNRLPERECSTAKPAHPCEMRRIDALHRMSMQAERSGELFEFVDEAGDDRQASGPEGGVGRLEAERREQLAMPHRAARPEHFEVALGEPLVRVLVNRVERIHQTIAESIGVDVARGVNEMRDVRPGMPV